MRGLLVFGFILIAMAGSHAHAGYTCNIQYGGTVNVPCDTGGETAACSYVENTVADWSCGQGEQWVHSLTGTSGTISGPGPGSITCTIPYTPPAGGSCGSGGTWVPQINFVSDGCAAGEVFNSQTQQCEPVQPPQDCTSTIGSTLSFPQPSATQISGKYCSSSCEYSLSYYEIIDPDFGFAHYIGNGNSCGTEGGSNPAPVPENPDPIVPTNPEPEIPDDGNTTPEPATDEGQETISGQLGGIQNQLQNLEGGTAGLQQGQNTQTSILQQIANSLDGTGTGSSGTGTGDQDGDGTDDSFTDGGCSGPPACNGPAIECAIAAQAYYTRCNLQIDEPAIVENDIRDAIDSTLPTIEEMFDPTNPDNNIDVTEYLEIPTLNSGSCPADYSVTVFGQPITFSWSFVCEFLLYTRDVVLALAWLISGFIFYKGLIRDF